MLILSRREEEAISLIVNQGDDCGIVPITMTVQILSIRGSQVQLGISAPDAVRIARDDMQATRER